MANATVLVVNGVRHDISSPADTSLLNVLRDELGLTGSKYGCGEGQCGACTVLVDGSPRRSCVTKLQSVGTSEITTIEGLDREGKLHPLQQAFIDADAMQCAYCTSGMIVTGVALLRENHHPSDSEIIDSMQGNICRCGTYPRIVAAVHHASEIMKGGAR